jgi:membrane protease YdiL (CAAX protease family)
MIKLKNKKGIAIFYIIAFIILGLVAIYLILLLPIPAFKLLRTKINYFLLLAFFIILQVGIIFGYYELGKFGFKIFGNVRKRYFNILNKINKMAK